MEGKSMSWKGSWRLWIVSFILFYGVNVFQQYQTPNVTTNCWSNFVVYPLCFAWAAIAVWWFRSRVRNVLQWKSYLGVFGIAFWGTSWALISVNAYGINVWNAVFKSKNTSKSQAYGHDFAIAFLVAGLFEEIGKAIITRFSIDYYFREKLEPTVDNFKKLTFMGLACGLGMTVAETILYSCRNHAADGWGSQLQQVFTRSVMPFHGIWGIMWGIGIARRVLLGENFSYWKMLLVPLLTHGTWDFIIFVGETNPDLKLLSLINLFIISPLMVMYAYHSYIVQIRHIEAKVIDNACV
jgi:RsiW-degrading membrane proteinase PrsW (M82 family)